MIAELALMGNVDVTRDILYGSVDSRAHITIKRAVEHAELLDHMPSQFGEDLWLKTLLCHGGSLVREVAVNVNLHMRMFDERPHPEFRWYPRSLLKTLLLVGEHNFGPSFFKC